MSGQRFDHRLSGPGALARRTLVVCAAAALAAPANAGTPIALRESIAGPVEFVGTAATLRAEPNSGDDCAVLLGASATLSGLPAGATVRRALLSWAGSYSALAGSTRATPDFTVTFDGATVTADRQYTESYDFGGTPLDFFNGVADVTSVVAVRGNATYALSDLEVNTDAPHCAPAAVLAGWALYVVYEHPAEPLRVINLFEGFEQYRGSRITLTPSNFRIPVSPIDGRYAHLCWEGDESNSGTLGGFSERLAFEGVDLADAENPLGNPYNSTTTITTPAAVTTWGVDLDVYDISPLLSAGQTSASTVFESGADLVLLSAEIVGVTNEPVADLSIDKSHPADFVVGSVGSFTIRVANLGPDDEPGPVTVDDTLPSGMAFSGWSGGGWSCSATGPDVACDHAGPLPAGSTLPDLTLEVLPDATSPATVTNTATVSGTLFDNVGGNNADADVANVLRPATAGNKPLYVATNPSLSLSRTPPPSGQPNEIVDRLQIKSWTMTPPAAESLVLDAAPGSIPVELMLRKGGAGAGGVSRTLRVGLRWIGPTSGPIGTPVTRTVTLTGTPQQTTFSIPLGADVTLPAGARIVLDVQNVTPGSNRRRVRLFPTASGGRSRVELSASTVIRVDVVEVHSAAWPTSAPLAWARPGDRVWFRAVVADPFGSFDIAGALVEPIDPLGSPVGGAIAMTLVADSGVATRTYEAPFDVPGTGPTGSWTGRVTAEEGTEGLVRDVAVTSFPVIDPPSLTIHKSADVTGAAPGDDITYAIVVANPTAASAAEVVAEDELGAYAALALDPFGLGSPLEVIDGATASGLSAGAPQFSDDGGSSFGYTPVSGGGGAPAGHDANVTHWRLPMSGSMNGSGAEFTVRYRVRVR